MLLLCVGKAQMGTAKNIPLFVLMNGSKEFALS